MQHFDKDTLLKYSLEILNEEESKNVLHHLNNCELCRNTLEEKNEQIKTIKSFDPKICCDPLPIIKSRRNYSTWIKRAAIVIFVMFIGYSGNNYFPQKEVLVTGQTFTSKNKTLDSLNFIYCPPVDLYSRE